MGGGGKHWHVLGVGTLIKKEMFAVNASAARTKPRSKVKANSLNPNSVKSKWFYKSFAPAVRRACLLSATVDRKVEKWGTTQESTILL